MHPRVLQYKNACHRLALKYSGIISKEDLVQEAYIATDMALRKFDPNRGATELTYVYFCVTRRIWTCLKKQRRQNRGLVWCEDTPEKSYADPEPNRLDLDFVLSHLNEQELDIILQRFKGVKQPILAEKYSVTKQRISQIQMQALKKCRNVFEPTINS